MHNTHTHAHTHTLRSHSVEKFPDEPCLGSRLINEDGSAGAFDFLSYAQVMDVAAGEGGCVVQGVSVAVVPLASLGGAGTAWHGIAFGTAWRSVW